MRSLGAAVYELARQALDGGRVGVMAWLTRDRGRKGDYALWRHEPRLKPGVNKWYGLGGLYLEMSVIEFQRLFRVHLASGEIRRVKSITIELEDK